MIVTKASGRLGREGWTLLVILWGFRQSTGLGIVMLAIFGPIFFVITMIYVRVWLELLIVFFRIQGDVNEINRRGGADEAGTAVEPVAPPPAAAGPVTVEAPSTPAPETSFCATCGTEQPPGKRFCTACGAAVE